MNLRVIIDEAGRPAVAIGERLWVWRIGIRFPQGGNWLRDGKGDFTGADWEEGTGEDRLGQFRLWRRTYSLRETPVLALTLRAYPEAVLVEVELLRDLSGLSLSDSFEDATFLAPTFSFSDDMQFILATFGLGTSGDGYPGGYWPTAVIGTGPGELPREAFAPLVLFTEAGALAVSPANYFLTSPLVRVPGGAARGLHGSVDRLPAGTRLSTLFAVGEDPMDAIRRLGDLLLRLGGKKRERAGHPLLDSLGWWNAYGGYYTELIRPLTASSLEEVVRGLKELGVPIRYLGLDLWYPYKEIGRARRYRPDPEKYPEGLRALSARTGLPYVLHLSALAEENEYGASGGDPGVYRVIAEELAAEGGIAAWHDWLRTQQHLTPGLRADPEAAERWFSGMAKAFAEAGLPVLLCMQTMGMNLASTHQPGVIAARSHTDFLFSLREALERAACLGHGDLLEAWIHPGVLRRQNLLMGAMLHALGLAPFHDLFLSRPHPGLGGDTPLQDAVLRALSCGPVGIGDGPGMTDPKLLSRLLVGETIARPDRPPTPLLSTLTDDIQTFWTETAAGDAKWRYVLVLNTAEEELPFRVDLPWEGEYLTWDGFTGRPVEEVAGRLAPGEVAYFVLSPLRGGIAPWGLADRLVPAPQGHLQALLDGKGWRLNTPGGRLLFWSQDPITASTERGRTVTVSRQEHLWLLDPGEEPGWLFVRRR